MTYAWKSLDIESPLHDGPVGHGTIRLRPWPASDAPRYAVAEPAQPAWAKWAGHGVIRLLASYSRRDTLRVA